MYVCVHHCMNSFTPKYTLLTLWPFVMQWMVRTENNANACLMKTCKQICKQANRKTSIGCDFEDSKRYKPNQIKPKQIQSTWKCEHFSLTPVDQWNFSWNAWGIRYNHKGLMSKRKIASYMWLKKNNSKLRSRHRAQQKSRVLKLIISHIFFLFRYFHASIHPFRHLRMESPGEIIFTKRDTKCHP